MPNDFKSHMFDIDLDEITLDDVQEQLEIWNKKFKEEHMDVDDPGKKFSSPEQYWYQNISWLCMKIEQQIEENALEEGDYGKLL